MLLADTKVRWEQLDSTKETYFLTGTDEHGLKIQAAAEKGQVDPKLFVDRVSENFKKLASTFKVQADRFIRTTDQDHLETVQYFWKQMIAKGLIYKGSHSGWYSISDEAFYPESQITEAPDRKTGTIKKISIETGNEVHYQEEENYFFRLGQFKTRLIEFLEENPTFVFPESKYRELLSSLKAETLEDLSVSRPSSRLKWGIAVPEDDSQKIYVWFDALVNYLTAAGYPTFKAQEKMTQSDSSIWPPDTHIVGKDITRFHCVYWPIFLMAAGVELPKQVLVHSHWLSEGVKMSKSLGNVVDPFGLSECYGTDPTRFYLMENASIANDCKFSEREIQNSYSLLVNKWANICSRVGGEKFSLCKSVLDQSEGRFENINELIMGLGPQDSSAKTIELRDKLVRSINSLYGDMNEEMKNYGQMRALQRWWETVELGNEFFQHCEPWRYQSLAKSEEILHKEYETFANYAVYLCAEAGRVTSICVSPFMPDLASKFLGHWSIPRERRSSNYCLVGADLKYGSTDKSNGSFKVMTKLKKQ
ncbi:hypothetical protein JCM33374_g5181 [Metschnikowia sp. JCM 33374]|nr:hypothetical protein JCM33374_g5181 [Metschnikowia sp. JCM 33374]